MRGTLVLVEYAENKLGLPIEGKPGDPPWKARALEAGILGRAMEKRNITPDTYRKIVDWLASQHRAVKRPASVCAFHRDWVRAMGARPKSELAPTIALRDAYLEEVNGRSDPEWVSRLARAHPSAATELIAEWQASKAAS